MSNPSSHPAGKPNLPPPSYNTGNTGVSNPIDRTNPLGHPRGPPAVPQAKGIPPAGHSAKHPPILPSTSNVPTQDTAPPQYRALAGHQAPTRQPQPLGGGVNLAAHQSPGANCPPKQPVRRALSQAASRPRNPAQYSADTGLSGNVPRETHLPAQTLHVQPQPVSVRHHDPATLHPPQAAHAPEAHHHDPTTRHPTQMTQTPVARRSQSSSTPRSYLPNQLLSSLFKWTFGSRSNDKQQEQNHVPAQQNTPHVVGGPVNVASLGSNTTAAPIITGPQKINAQHLPNPGNPPLGSNTMVAPSVNINTGPQKANQPNLGNFHGHPQPQSPSHGSQTVDIEYAADFIRRAEPMLKSLGSNTPTHRSDLDDARKAIEALKEIEANPNQFSPQAAEILRARFDHDIGFRLLNEAPFVKCLPVLAYMKNFLSASAPYVNFTSPTGTGKSMAVPVFYLARGVDVAVKYNKPTLLIMSQPKAVPVKQSKKNMRDVLSRVSPAAKRLVHCHEWPLNTVVKNLQEPKNRAQAHFTVCLPQVALSLFFALYKAGLLHLTRWVIDEVHERSAETDLLLTYLSLVRVGGAQNQPYLPPSSVVPKNRFSTGEEITEAVVTLMTATPDSSMRRLIERNPPPALRSAQSSRIVQDILIENKALFPVVKNVSQLSKKSLKNNKLEKHCAEIAVACVFRMFKSPPKTHDTFEDQAALKVLQTLDPEFGNVLSFMAGFGECVKVSKFVSEHLPSGASDVFPVARVNGPCPAVVIALSTVPTVDDTEDSFRTKLKTEMTSKVNDAALNVSEPSFIPSCIIIVVPLIIAGRAPEASAKLALSPLTLETEVQLRPEARNALAQYVPAPVPKVIPVRIVKVIAATNAVESSVTIDNLSVVVDSGFHKEGRYDPVKDITTLELRPIPQSSIKQRAGRCGRTQKGWVWRVESSTPAAASDIQEVATPELLTADFGRRLLQLLQVGVDMAGLLPFLPTKLPEERIKGTYDRLLAHQMVTYSNNKYSITNFGRQVDLFDQSIPTVHAAVLLKMLKEIGSDSKLTADQKRSEYLLYTFILATMVHWEQGTFKEDLCAETFKPLEKFFCKSSDVVTVAKATLHCLVSGDGPAEKRFWPSIRAPKVFMEDSFKKIRNYVCEAISALVPTKDNNFDPQLVPQEIKSWYFSSNEAAAAPAIYDAEDFEALKEEEEKEMTLWQQVSLALPREGVTVAGFEEKLVDKVDNVLDHMFAVDPKFKENNLLKFRQVANIRENPSIIFAAQPIHHFEGSVYKGGINDSDTAEARCYNRPLADFPYAWAEMYAIRIARNETSQVNAISLLHRRKPQKSARNALEDDNYAAIFRLSSTAQSLPAAIFTSYVEKLDGIATRSFFLDPNRRDVASTVIRAEPLLSPVLTASTEKNATGAQAVSQHLLIAVSKPQTKPLGTLAMFFESLIRLGCSKILHLVSCDVSVLYTGIIKSSCLVPQAEAILKATNGIPTEGLYCLPHYNPTQDDRFNQVAGRLCDEFEKGEASLVIVTSYQISPTAEVRNRLEHKLSSTLDLTNGTLPLEADYQRVNCCPFVAVYVKPSAQALRKLLIQVTPKIIVEADHPLSFSNLSAARSLLVRNTGDISSSGLVHLIPAIFVEIDRFGCPADAKVPDLKDCLSGVRLDGKNDGVFEKDLAHPFAISNTRITTVGAKSILIALKIPKDLTEQSFSFLREDPTKALKGFLDKMPGAKLAKRPFTLGAKATLSLVLSPQLQLMAMANGAETIFSQFHNIINTAVSMVDENKQWIAISSRADDLTFFSTKMVREIKEGQTKGQFPTFATHTIDIPVLTPQAAISLATNFAKSVSGRMFVDLDELPLPSESPLTWEEIVNHTPAFKAIQARMHEKRDLAPKVPPPQLDTKAPTEKLSMQVSSLTSYASKTYFFIPQYASRLSMSIPIDYAKLAEVPTNDKLLEMARFYEPTIQEIQVNPDPRDPRISVPWNNDLSTIAGLWRAMSLLANKLYKLCRPNVRPLPMVLLLLDNWKEAPANLTAKGAKRIDGGDLKAEVQRRLPGLSATFIFDCSTAGAILSVTGKTTEELQSVACIAEELVTRDIGQLKHSFSDQKLNRIQFTTPLKSAEVAGLLQKDKARFIVKSYSSTTIVNMFADPNAKPIKKLAEVADQLAAVLNKESTGTADVFCSPFNLPQLNASFMNLPAIAVAAKGFMVMPQRTNECQLFVKNHILPCLQFTKVPCEWLNHDLFFRLVGRWRRAEKRPALRNKIRPGFGVSYFENKSGGGYMIIDKAMLPDEESNRLFNEILEKSKNIANTMAGTAEGEAPVGCVIEACDAETTNKMCVHNATGQEISVALCAQCTNQACRSHVSHLIEAVDQIRPKRNCSIGTAPSAPSFTIPTAFASSARNLLGSLWWTLFAESREESLDAKGNVITPTEKQIMCRDAIDALSVWMTFTSLNRIATNRREWFVCDTHMCPYPIEKRNSMNCGCVWCVHGDDALGHAKLPTAYCDKKEIAHVADPDCPKCPNCQVPIIRVGGCCAIECRCGFYWCYLCPPRTAFSSTKSRDVHDHSTAVHNDRYAFSKEPPHVIALKSKFPYLNQIS